ncbi:hypothetical protein [Brachyspira hyodysenteriae]|uniref:hypothetical protein n=1 Tax=Brachyspira hyodysenteriae TaxID=159 RepID=UPI00063DADE5|nr:hypothetical protein [Brachyspira hyodysenteriae]KLI43196.1 hypothetical protein SZ53_04815 [Brachyspira hyodysenteriae]
MIKKVLLIAAFIIFAVSCSKTPTDPTNNGNTGDSGIIDGGSGTSDETKISTFLSKHTGRYYQDASYGYINVSYKIENGEIYEAHSQSPINGTKTLLESENKLQLEYKDNYNNDKIIILNFINGNIYKYSKSIYKQETFSEKANFIKLGSPISSLATYKGNYYTLYSTASGEEKEYYLLIGNDGQVYVRRYTDPSGVDIYNYKSINFANNIISINLLYSYEGQSAEATLTYLIKDGKLIDGDQYMNGQLQSTELKKSDLFNDYVGTYSSQDGVTTLNVSKDYAYISGSISINGEAILLGNTMTIAKYVQSSYTYKRHTIVFSSDKKTATYTDPDTKKETVLTR